MKLRKLLKGTPAHPLPPPRTVSGQCTAFTGRGAQCKNPAVKGSDRCVLPAHQRM